MARESEVNMEEAEKLISNGGAGQLRASMDSISSASTTSLVLENLNLPSQNRKIEPLEYRDDDSDPELPRWRKETGFQGDHSGIGSRMSKHLKRVIWIVSVIAIVGWALALLAFVLGGRYQHSSTRPYEHDSPAKDNGKKITLDMIQRGYFYPSSSSIQWIAGPSGEDGLLLETGQSGKDFLVVEDVRSRKGDPDAFPSRTLLKHGFISTSAGLLYVEDAWPSPDFKKVLIVTKKEKNFRHSYTGLYFIVDVETQTPEALDPAHHDARVQLAQWSPTSDSIVFTRENDLFLRVMSSDAVRQITTDGGPEYFYGIPDWVYEEEVLQGNVGTWWSREGQYIALLRTNETMVPEYPVEFFFSRPSNVMPEPGLEKYPEVEQIKYPKAGAPNPTVDMMFYDVARNEIFSVNIEDGFPDDDKIIADVIWADDGRCLIRQLNRESDHIKMVLIDVPNRNGKVVRKVDVKALDNGWVEPGQTARYIPADPNHDRPDDGYLDVVIHDDNEHLAFFSPMDNPEPSMLTSGNWSIEAQAYALDLTRNIAYFVAAKESSIERHVYSVDLKGQDLKAIVPTDKPAYYNAHFSINAGYVLLDNSGPGVPTQKVVSTPSNPVQYEEVLNDNKQLADLAAEYELPQKIFSTVTIEGVALNVMEFRPRHFDSKKKYPVLFHQYSGPGSQSVNRRFSVDFQSYVASTLGYIVVTVDGRGTGFIGRKAQCITRGELGKYEANDQIETAKIWAQKSYVDADLMAIWGWSFGGFTTLKVLEVDAGRTFKYGVAVAPVTDWRFYDSIYTERYMFTPQNNPQGYDRSAVTNATALSQNVRFMIMHGVADDNVHMQNTLAVIDKLDLAGIVNYDVHFFPDSNHNIGFHGANNVVYEKIEKWLISAFNGLFYKYDDPVPEY